MGLTTIGQIHCICCGAVLLTQCIHTEGQTPPNPACSQTARRCSSGEKADIQQSEIKKSPQLVFAAEEGLRCFTQQQTSLAAELQFAVTDTVVAVVAR